MFDIFAPKKVKEARSILKSKLDDDEIDLVMYFEKTTCLDKFE